MPDAAASKAAMELLGVLLVGLASVNICSWRMGSAMRPKVGPQSQRGRSGWQAGAHVAWHAEARKGSERAASAPASALITQEAEPRR